MELIVISQLNEWKENPRFQECNGIRVAFFGDRPKNWKIK